MELKATIDIIIKDLNDAREIIDDLKTYPGVPELQIELAKAKCKSAADILNLLKSAGFSQATAPEHKTEAPPVQSKEKIAESQVVEHAIQLTEKPEKVEVVIAEAPLEKPELPQAPKQQVPVKKPEHAIIADQFSQPATFNEEIGSHKQEDILEIIRTKPVTSLTEAIGINDKFLFIREIFHGNQDSYNDAIVNLESAGSITDARAIIAGFSGEDSDNEAVRQLIDLIKRKFPSNE